MQDFCNSLQTGKAIPALLSSAQRFPGNEEVWQLGERGVALMQTQAMEKSLGGRLALALPILLMQPPGQTPTLRRNGMEIAIPHEEPRKK